MTDNGANKPRILIVDDEDDLRWVLCNVFQEAGFSVRDAGDGEEALALAKDWPPQVLLTDVRMPKCNGIELIQRLRKIHPGIPAVVLSAVDQVDTAVAAMKEGACDYAVKPFDNERLITLVKKTLKEKGAPNNSGTPARGIADLGISEQAQDLAREVTRIAKTDLTILIQGESGTGKEFLARAIHALSTRLCGPFVAVDCGALPSTLAESLLFGHRRGAFTGADQDREGLFTAANGGTLFLDEIGNLPPEIQPKLLRVLQERTVTPLGQGKTTPFDARIVCATNVDLHAMAEKGSFRIDLLHRINEYLVRIPGLAERPDDVAYFAAKFLDNETLDDREVKELTDSAVEFLKNKTWPGNLRELRNAIRRGAVLASDNPILPEHLESQSGTLENEPDIPGFSGECSLTEEVRRATDNLERDWILQALEQADGNKAEAARILKVDYTTLHRKLKRYDLDD